ncbi:hypothetical protein T492DRAFT_1083048 [Pavlovales sp. CCMP2436]|nr:hypothetical protein T492DRAFT_1083048 [Pavlovales sp. CCMP2436]
MRADRVPISLADGRKALTQAVRRGWRALSSSRPRTMHSRPAAASAQSSTRLQCVHVLAQRRTLLVEHARVFRQALQRVKRRALVVDRALLKAHAAAVRRGSPPSPSGGRRACRIAPRGHCAWRAPARAAAAPNAEAQVLQQHRVGRDALAERQVETERLAVGCFPRGSPEELCRSLIGGAREERARVEETAGHLTVLADLLQHVPLR